MKNKKMTFALIFAVSCVWGIIFYRIFSAAGSDEGYAIKTLAKKEAFEPIDSYLKEDTSRLVLNYADPFLRDAAKETVPLPEVTPAAASMPAQRMPMTKPVVQKPFINWSIIKYTGYIVNPEGKKTVSILTVNGKEYMLSEGEAAEGVKLLKSMKDSVKVLYQQNTRFIKLQV